MDRIEYFAGLVAESPDEPRARYGYAGALRQAGRYDDAVAEYRVYLQLADDEGAGWGYLAECLRLLGREDEAADAYLSGIDAAARHGHSGLASEFEEAMEGLG